MKGGMIWLFLLSFVSILCASVSASITLPSFDAPYSLGDFISPKMTVTENFEVKGFFKLNLECSDSPTNLFTMPVDLKANEEKSFELPSITLNKKDSCYLRAYLEDERGNILEERNSDKFIVSDAVDISLTLNKETFSPGDQIKINGEAIKANGNEFQGTASIYIDRPYTVSVRNGKFSLSDSIGKSTKSGDLNVQIILQDSLGNNGNASKTIKILQVPTSIVISSNNSLFPGDNLTATAKLLDQAGEEIENEVILTLYDSWGNEVIRKTVYNENFEYQSKNTDSPGNWWIYAYSSDLKERKFIYMNEIKKIDMSISGNLLNITNTGNVPYNSPLTVYFEKNNETRTQTIGIDLGIGKSKILGLSGEGAYKIEAKSSNFSNSFDQIILTGGAIGAKESGSPIKMIIAGVFILLIVIFAIFFKMRESKNISIKETITVNQNRI